MERNKNLKEVEPAVCKKAHNPYTYCPLAMKHSDDMILSYVNSLAVDIKRLNHLPMRADGIDEARALDRYTGEITAYMNGRVHGIIHDCFSGMICVPDVYREVMKEREHQDELWGSAHDDQHTQENWMDLLQSYINKPAVSLLEDASLPEFRHRLVQVAAIAVAALESYERKKGAVKC